MIDFAGHNHNFLLEKAFQMRQLVINFVGFRNHWVFKEWFPGRQTEADYRYDPIFKENIKEFCVYFG